MIHARITSNAKINNHCNGLNILRLRKKLHFEDVVTDFEKVTLHPKLKI